MATRQQRLVPLPENILSFSVTQGRWNGIGVDVTEAVCAGRVLHHLCYENETRLNVLLEEVSHSPCEPRTREHQPCPTGYTPRHLYMAPAGMDLWGYCKDMRYARDVTLTFDVPALQERFHVDLSCLATPRLRFSDDRLWTLVKLLSQAIGSREPAAQLYGDGLTAAIVARLAERHDEVPPARGKLMPWKLRRVTEYIEHHADRRIELAELAAIAGLSQAHFGRAFKASTGHAPYQWQLQLRIARAKSLLASTQSTLDDVAQSTGFADAMHFGRTFRRFTGCTPAKWRNDQQA